MKEPQRFRPRLPDGGTVKLIGLGGVGSIVARYGAMFLASLQSEVRLVLVEGDQFEASNGNRMYFSRQGNKASVIEEELRPRFADSSLALVTVEEYVTPSNVAELVHEGDIVILAVDNHATRKLVNDHCASLEDVCLISGGNDGIGVDGSGKARHGTYGNVQIFLRCGGKEFSPSLTHLHPEIAVPADKLPTDLSCSELVASVPQILFTNLAVASAILNALWLLLSEALPYGEVAFDISRGLMRPVTELKR